MPLFSRARALAHIEHIPSTIQTDPPGDPATRDNGHVLARMLRDAQSAVEHHRFGSDEIAARAIQRKIRRADARDLEL